MGKPSNEILASWLQRLLLSIHISGLVDECRTNFLVLPIIHAIAMDWFIGYITYGSRCVPCIVDGAM